MKKFIILLFTFISFIGLQTNYAQFFPGYVVVCASVTNVPPGMQVPVVVSATPGAAGDTIWVSANGIACDTIQLASGTNLIWISMTNCNGSITNIPYQINPAQTTITVTLNYCPVNSPVTVCGTVSGTNGTSVTVVITDPLTGIAYSIVTDTSGAFCDTLNIPNASAQTLSAYIIDCNGIMVSQTATYNAGSPNFNFTFNYCSSPPNPNNIVLCVTVSNLPGGTVPVIVQQGPNVPNDTLFFSGTGTQTVCDTFQLMNAAGVFVVSLTDCNGNIVSTLSNLNPGGQTAVASLNYCQPTTAVTVCGSVSGTNGQSITVYILDSLSGLNYTIQTDISGNFCDTLLLPAPVSQTLTAYIICAGGLISQTANYNTGSPNFNFTFTNCSNPPNATGVLCVTMSGLPGGISVPVIVQAANGVPGDTLFFTGTGTQTICDTLPLVSSGGVYVVSFTDCNGNVITATAMISVFNPVANITLNYCGVPPCYAFWTSTYDTTNNTFYITVDSITLAQATTFFWDFGDGTTSTLPNPTHQFAQNGLYNVCLTINASPMSPGCMYCHIIGITPNGGIITRGQQGFNVVVLPQNTTGIEESDDLNYTIYPNPVSEVLIVESDQHSINAKLSIYTVSGKLVLEHANFNEDKIEVNVGDLPSGIYVARLVSDSSSVSLKFVKD